jgi:hypothetical protein
MMLYVRQRGEGAIDTHRHAHSHKTDQERVWDCAFSAPPANHPLELVELLFIPAPFSKCSDKSVPWYVYYIRSP